MAITLEERSNLEATLDECETALAAKPTLAAIYDIDWRQKKRGEIAALDSVLDMA